MSILPFPQQPGFAPAWDVALNLFLLYKRGEGVSARTLADYEKHVSRFFRRYPAGLANPALRSCVLEHLSDDISPYTYNLRLVYLRCFFRWCVDEGYLGEDPTGRLHRRKTPPRIVNVPTDCLTKLLSFPDRTTFAGLRDYALILLTLDTGIRPGEALSLRPCHIDLKYAQVTIPSECAKTRVSRTLPISGVTVQALLETIRARHPQWGESVPLFCSASGLPLRDEWARRIAEYGRRMGIRLRPYDLRHSFALHYLRHGGNAFALQRTLGHEDMAMTRRYVALTDQDLRKVHSTASPVQVLVPERHRVRKAGKANIKHT